MIITPMQLLFRFSLLNIIKRGIIRTTTGITIRLMMEFSINFLPLNFILLKANAARELKSRVRNTEAIVNIRVFAIHLGNISFKKTVLKPPRSINFGSPTLLILQPTLLFNEFTTTKYKGYREIKANKISIICLPTLLPNRLIFRSVKYLLFLFFKKLLICPLSKSI